MVFAAPIRATKILFVVFSLAFLNLAVADQATWTGAVGTDWSDVANWSGVTSAPITSDDTALFTTAIPPTSQPNNSDDIEIAGLDFNSAIGTFEITNSNVMTITTDGIMNTSGNTQNITNDNLLVIQAGNIDENVTIFNSATLRVNNADEVIIAGVIDGAGTLQKQAGDGNLILTGDNTYTGDTFVSNGFLQIGDNGTTGSLDSPHISNTGGIIFYRSDLLAYEGFIDGPGGVTKKGGDVLILTGDNEYEWNTVVDEGTLQLGNDTDTGSVTSNIIINNAALVFNRSSNKYIYDYVISGSGQVTQAGSGTLVLTQDNIYDGDITVTNGDLQLGNNTDTGSVLGNIYLENDSHLVFKHSHEFTYEGLITGQGEVFQSSGAKLILTHDNDYDGGTVLDNGGILQLGVGGSTGSVIGNISLGDGSRLIINRSNEFDYDGVISGSGSLEKDGRGRLKLLQDNLYLGDTTVNAGVLQFGIGLGAGSVSGNIINNGNVLFNRNDTFNYNYVISGTGTVDKGGIGTSVLVFTRDNTYMGDTHIIKGTLQLGDGGDAGSVAGNIINDVALVFDRSKNLTFSHDISGAGTVTQAGDATVTLTGNNTYEGLTTISAGGLSFGNGGVVNSIPGNIVNDGELIFDHSNELTYNGVITGLGSFRKQGDGKLILNGENEYEGDTLINEGTVFIGADQDHHSAQVGGNVIVNNSALLGGFGVIVSDLTLNGTATVSPGASIGTIQVNGKYIQTAGTTYFVELNANNESDVLSVTGAAYIQGGDLLVDMSQGFNSSFAYPILTASSVTGVFDNITVLQDFFAAELEFSDNAILLSPSFSSSAFNAAANTPNQEAVAQYLLETGGTFQIQQLIAAMTDADELDLLLDQLSAATYADQELQLAQTARWFDAQMAARMQAYSRCEGITYTPADEPANTCAPHPALWVLPYGSRADLAAGQVSGLQTDMGGVALGVDFPVSKAGKVGAAFSANYFSGHADGQEIATDEGMLYQLGLYGDYVLGDWIVGMSMALSGTDDISATRDITVGNGMVAISGSYSSAIVSEQIKLGYDWQIHHNHIRPFVELLGQQVSRDAFKEGGNPGFALTVENSDYDSVSSQLGALFEMPVGELTFLGSLSWRHEFADIDATVCATIASQNSVDRFNVQSTEIGRDAVLINAGILLLPGNEINITVLYQGVFANAYQENGAKLQFDFDLS